MSERKHALLLSYRRAKNHFTHEELQAVLDER